jgi:hypothetical protein
MENELFILWTSDNPITAEKMVFMYAHNSILEKWWNKVTLIIWGSTAKLSAENENIREKLIIMQNDGVKISACKACADQLGVTEKLEDIGIEVIYWGKPLTEIIKSGKKLICI